VAFLSFFLSEIADKSSLNFCCILLMPSSVNSFLEKSPRNFCRKICDQNTRCTSSLTTWYQFNHRVWVLTLFCWDEIPIKGCTSILYVLVFEMRVLQENAKKTCWKLVVYPRTSLKSFKMPSALLIMVTRRVRSWFSREKTLFKSNDSCVD